MLRSKHSGWTWEGKRTPFVGGGGGGGGPTTTQSTGTTYNTNIPEYAQPYVENMLGATQKQLFTMGGDPDMQKQIGTDESGQPIYQTIPGNQGQITGFKPYQPYSTNVNDYVAGFSPMQQQAMQATGQLGVPSQYGQATQMTGMAGLGSLGLAGQMAGAGQNFAQQAQDPNSIAGYMSPYMQNVVDYQKSQAVRDYGLGTGVRKAQAVGQGAFGGNRQALMEAEAQRSLGNQLQGITAQGSQQAFQNAQQAQQYGANLGLQGQQAALQGVGQYGQMAGQLGQLGGQQLKAQQDVIQAQYGMGQQQQAAEQQKINQAIQDWANTQQYPLMQLGVMSNMLRGLPMQASTTNQYTAAPNALTQGIGAAGAGASLYNALKGKEGGLPSEFESSKTGIKSYYEGDVVESTKSDLYDLPLEELEKRAKSSTSPTIKRLASAIVKEKRMGLAGGGIIAFQNRGLVPGTENVPEADRGNELLKEYLETNPRTPPNVQPKEPIISSFEKSKRIPVDVKEPGQDVKEFRESLTNFKLPDAPSSLEKGIKTAKQPKPEVATPELVEIPPPTTTAASAAAAPKELPPMPTNVKVDDKGRADANKQDGKPAATPVVNPASIVAAKPASPTAPTAGIKIPGLEEPSADPYAKMSIEEIAAKKLGFLGGDVRKEERAGLMAERVSAKDEARRAQSMRMAEFFAAWGSTPGSTITAGLTALKTKLPDIITDGREEAKIRRAINKDIAALDKADRLEKSGAWDEAAKIKQDQAKNAYNVWGKKVDYLSARESDESRASAQIRAAEIGAASRTTGKDDLPALQGRLNSANENLRKWEDDNSSLIRKANRANPKNDADLQKSIDAAKAQLNNNEQYKNLKADRDAIKRVIDANPRIQSASEGTKSDTSGSSAGKVIQYDAKGNRV
jgi:hypothetical protein